MRLSLQVIGERANAVTRDVHINMLMLRNIYSGHAGPAFDSLIARDYIPVRMPYDLTAVSPDVSGLSRQEPRRTLAITHKSTMH